MAHTWIITAAAAFSGMVTLLLEMVLLVAIVTVVRKHRPDAWGVLASGAALHVAGIVLGYVGTTAAGLVVSRGGGGMESYVRVMPAIQVGVTLVTGVGRALVIAGILRLARTEPVFPGYV